MSESLNQARQRADSLMQGGKLAAALEQYLRVLSVDPADVASRQKVADLYSRFGRRHEAVEQYFEVVSRYARGGHFFEAMAICRVILSLEPGHRRAQQVLANLYSSSRQAGAQMAERPVSVPVDQPGLQRAFAEEPPLLEAEVVEDELLLDDIVDDEPMTVTPASARPLPVIPLFSQLSSDDFVAVLSSAMEVRTYSAGQAIVQEGEEGDSMFALVQGTVGVYREVDGNAQRVAQMQQGDFFGEMALMARARRLASVVAETPAMAIEFPRAAMQSLLESNPSVAVALDAFYRERLLANLLRCNPLLHPLSDDEKVEIAGKFEVRSYEAGQVILLQGQPGDGLYLILRGQCAVIDRSGARYRSLGEGEAFGEISVALRQGATANVRAETRVVALRLPVETVHEVLLQNQRVRAIVDQWIAARLQNTAELVIRRPSAHLDRRV